MSKTFRIILLSSFAGMASASVQEDDRILKTLRQNDAIVQNLKTRSINLLGAMHEYKNQNYYPAEQRLEVFVTSPARRFTVKQLELLSGESTLANTEFDDDAVYAMRVGGTKSVYLGNVPTGRFSLQVNITGEMPDGNVVTHQASMSLTKTDQPLALELTIQDSPRGSGVRLEAAEQEIYE